MSVINERLWIEMPGEVAVPHRVIPVGDPQLAEVGGRRQRSIAVRRIGDGYGPFLVPIAELVDAAPLTPAEIADYDRLDGELAGTIGDSRKLRAFNGLLHRRQIYGEAA
jgi:hypothetical protein